MLTDFYKQKIDTNLCSVIWSLTERLGVRSTRTAINTLLEKHVEYPSLLSVKDTLAGYGIESAAVRRGSHAYTAFETPFVCAIQQEDWGRPNFTVVTEADDNAIIYLEALTGELVTAPIATFEKLDKGIVLKIFH